MPPKPRASSYRSSVLLMLATTACCLVAVEVVFRWIGFRFDAGQQQAYEAYPIFYRQPRKPLGDISFQRHGPAEWTGQVLTSGLHSNGGLDDAYADEAISTINYDREGFRNPQDLEDWDVVVIGDSIVESGYLPYDALLTTQLGRLLGARVKNGGVSYSGPFTYVEYLRHFGGAPSARHALMVFFEGNDLDDVRREAASKHTFETTGARPYRTFETQTSFLTAIYRFARGVADEPVQGKRIFENARFLSPGGELAVSVSYMPPRPDQVSREARVALNRALAAWAATASGLGMRPWLVYMPSKRRVLDGYLHFSKDRAQPEIATWQPNELPAFVRELADQHGLDFIDVTPDLVRETRQGRMTYNGVWDTHLNRHGSSVVARALAEALRE
jgi:hypothetical protein